jgi:DnaJ like chaperone protein
MLLITLISTALADNELHSAEREILHQVAGHLDINSTYFEQILQMAGAQQGFGQQQRSYRQDNAFRRQAIDPVAEAYKALGVSADVTDRELKRAYRKLISQHHPDKLIAQGMPDDMIEIATEKTQAIQAAYELLQKERGLQR